MTGLDLVDLAASYGMSSVEYPLDMIPDHTEAGMGRFGELLRSKGMTFALDLPVLDVAQAQRDLPLAKRAGARVVRCMVSGFLEGADAISTMNVFRSLGVHIEGPAVHP